MQALYVILNRSDVVQDILVGLLKSGIKGATVYESHGLRELLPVDAPLDMPLFSRLTQFSEGKKVDNRTIMTVIEDKQLETTLSIVRNCLDQLTGDNSAFVFSVPVAFATTVSTSGRGNG